jgi:hypothetical protein
MLSLIRLKISHRLSREEHLRKAADLAFRLRGFVFFKSVIFNLLYRPYGVWQDLFLPNNLSAASRASTAATPSTTHHPPASVVCLEARWLILGARAIRAYKYSNTQDCSQSKRRSEAVLLPNFDTES